MRTISKNLPPHLRIGKNGLSPGMKEEILAILKRKGIIKIKLLPAALDHGTKDDYFKQLLDVTAGVHIHTLGLTITIYSPAYPFAKLRSNLYKAAT